MCYQHGHSAGIARRPSGALTVSETVRGVCSRGKSYVLRRLTRPRCLSLREAVNRHVARKRGARWVTPRTADGSRAALLPGVTVVTLRDEWGNARHGVFTADRLPIELQGTKCTKSHLNRLRAVSSEIWVKEGIWVAEDWQGNYYHWLIRHLPKLLLCEHGNVDLPLLLPKKCGMQEVISETLDVLRWPVERRVYIDTDVLKIDNGVFAQLAAFDRSLLPELSERLRSALGTSARSGIFISRAAASKRCIVREEDLTSELETFNITPVRFETLSFEEQRKVMSTTRLIVGMHGAGLTNMILMPPGGTVIEIVSDTVNAKTLFQDLARVLGHEYLRVPATTVDSERGHNANVRVNMSLVIDAVARKCPSSRAEFQAHT